MFHSNIWQIQGASSGTGVTKCIAFRSIQLYGELSQLSNTQFSNESFFFNLSRLLIHHL